MRTQKLSIWLTALLGVLVTAAAAPAQHYQPFGDLDMHYDFQLGAPPIVEEYGNEPVAPNYGWYVQYSRCWMNVNRPENQPSDFQGDFQWGNRIDIGYMTDEQNGWSTTIWHLNRQSAIEFTPVIDIQGNEFTLQNNINTGEYSGMEVNKTFRAYLPNHHIFIEPYAGFRWGEFEETIVVETLVFDNPAMPTMETGTGTSAVWENNMVGGQVGVRWFGRRGHWVLSGQVAGYAMQNWQFLNGRQVQIITVDDGMGDFITQSPVTTSIDENFDEVVGGFEFRAEAAYEITRKVRARFGFQLLSFQRGIARGFDQETLSGAEGNDMAVTYAGVVIGIDVNR